MSRKRNAETSGHPLETDCGFSRRALLGGGGSGLLAAGGTRKRPGFAQSATQTSPAANGHVHVSIVDKKMSMDDLRTAIATEGALVIGSEYPAGQDAIIREFAAYVEAAYGEHVNVSVLQETQDGDALATVLSDADARSPARIDVMATRKDHWFAAKIHAQSNQVKVLEDFLPSGLIPNAKHVFGLLNAEPTAVGFQSSVTAAVTYNANVVDFLVDWTDLADPRLKDRLLLWTPGDDIGDGMLLNVSAALKMDYRNPDHIDASIDFIVNEITPNALKYTNDLAEVTALLASGTVDAVVHWNAFARHQFAAGNTSARTLITTEGQYPFNGVLWIPAQPAHPILAQIFIDWRLSQNAQFPDLDQWGINQKIWLDLQDGLIRADLAESVPEWLANSYYDFYPTVDQIKKRYWDLDWEYYLATAPVWRDQWIDALARAT
jgi:ABC-type Fe3+ transport system substrate-binding protein